MSEIEILEQTLWKSANKLRGNVAYSEYRPLILGLVFLKYAGYVFEQQKNKLIEEGFEEYIENPSFYIQDRVFYLPPKSRWDYIVTNTKESGLAKKIDDAFKNIEKSNESLKGALPRQYYVRLELENEKLSSLIDTIENNIKPEKYPDEDIFGRIYEYFLSKFAEKENKGEFYTPKSIVNLIAEIIEPYDGKIYDPCCGSGGMFVQSLEFVKHHNGNSKNISIYGQEAITSTRKIALMNLAIRGLTGKLGERAADTFLNDLHKGEEYEYIMANPPFNLDDWREEKQLVNDERWSGYEIPPTSNANYAWILHMLSKLTPDGIAGFLLSNGSVTAKGVEYKIRKELIENDVIEAIITLPNKLFYSTNIGVTLWIMNKNKNKRTITKMDKVINYRDRKNEILFLDLRQMGQPYQKKYVELVPDERKKVTETIHNWQQNKEKYEDIAEYCYSANIEEIRKNNYSLQPSQYIEFLSNEDNTDFDIEFNKISNELLELENKKDKNSKTIKNLIEEIRNELHL